MPGKNDVKINLKAVDKFSSAIDRVTKKFPKMNREVRKANIAFKKMERSTRGIRNSMSKMGKGMTRVGKKMTVGVTAPIGLLGTQVIRTALDFEKGMNKVAALTGATGEEFAAMEKQARHLGSTTQFSASQAADAMAFLGMAGFDTNQIMKATPGLLDLAAASSIELGEAADITSNIMGAFNMTAEQTSKVADVLAKTTASSNTDMIQLAEAMKFAAPVAQKFGMSLEDTATAIGLLGNVGIQGTLAGTSIRKALLGLAAPGSEASKVMSSLGVKVADADGQMRKFPDIMKDFAVSMKDLPKSTQLQALNAVFGKTGISGAAALLDQLLPKVNDKTGKLEVGFDKLGQKIQNANGAAKNMAGIMQKGAVGAVTQLKSATEGLFIAIAKSGLLEAFTSIVKKVTEVVSSLSQSNPALLKMATIGLAVAAALGPLLAGIGLMASGISSLITFAGFLLPVLGAIKGAFLLIAGAISLPVAGIAALVAGLARVIFKWKELKSAFASGSGFLDTAKKLGSVFFGIGGGDKTQATQTNANQVNQAQANSNVVQTNNAQVGINIAGLPQGSSVQSDGVTDLSVAFAGAQGF